jgi:hypothetical protein
MKKCFVIKFLLMIFFTPSEGLATLIVNSPVTDWTEVSYGTNAPDYFDDQQTGQYDSDIVGSSTVPAFYRSFDDGGTPSLVDGTLGFRLRVSGSSKAYWDNIFWVGIDGDADGSMDLYASLAKDNTINLHGPGADLNTSPSTTSISSPLAGFSYAAVLDSNYSFMAVDAINAPGLPVDVDGYPATDGTDYFVSFSIAFADIVSALALDNVVVDENAPLVFLAATSTQANSLNQDISGAPKIDNSNKDLTWGELGAGSTPISANGLVVPEPASMALIGVGGLVALFYNRARRRI